MSDESTQDHATQDLKAQDLKESLRMSPFGNFLGITLDAVGTGTARCSIRLEPQHRNTGGRVHGGVLSALADTAAGVAVRSIRPAGKLSATTDLSIAFIRPPQGDSLDAVAEVIHAGKQLVRTEVAIHSAGKLVASTTATFMLFDPAVAQ